MNFPRFLPFDELTIRQSDLQDNLGKRGAMSDLVQNRMPPMFCKRFRGTGLPRFIILKSQQHEPFSLHHPQRST